MAEKGMGRGGELWFGLAAARPKEYRCKAWILKMDGRLGSILKFLKHIPKYLVTEARPTLILLSLPNKNIVWVYKTDPGSAFTALKNLTEPHLC
jgi:hypothetical protein